MAYALRCVSDALHLYSLPVFHTVCFDFHYYAFAEIFVCYCLLNFELYKYSNFSLRVKEFHPVKMHNLIDFQHKGFDANKLYASEILAIMLQDNDGTIPSYPLLVRHIIPMPQLCCFF